MFLSAVLAVLFGVWSLTQYGRENEIGSLLAALVAFGVSLASVSNGGTGAGERCGWASRTAPGAWVAAGR